MKSSIEINNNDHIKGKENAPVTLIEYGDFECPYCGEAYPIVKKIQKIKGDALKFVFRNFPLAEVHQHALHASYAAEAAAKQGKFWEMYDLLFKNQEYLDDKDLLSYAKDLKLDIDYFNKSIESSEIKNLVHEHIMSGIKGGVNGTPTFFVNGRRYDGPSEIDSILEFIEELSVNNKNK